MQISQKPWAEDVERLSEQPDGGEVAEPLCATSLGHCTELLLVYCSPSCLYRLWTEASCCSSSSSLSCLCRLLFLPSAPVLEDEQQHPGSPSIPAALGYGTAASPSAHQLSLLFALFTPPKSRQHPPGSVFSWEKGGNWRGINGREISDNFSRNQDVGREAWWPQ